MTKEKSDGRKRPEFLPSRGKGEETGGLDFSRGKNGASRIQRKGLRAISSILGGTVLEIISDLGDLAPKEQRERGARGNGIF